MGSGTTTVQTLGSDNLCRMLKADTAARGLLWMLSESTPDIKTKDTTL